ncbi:DUF2716 domain-containing protein [Streptomyces sp. NPDC048415]
MLEAAYRSVWDRFYAEFAFRPSVGPAKWPSYQGASRLDPMEPGVAG